MLGNNKRYKNIVTLIALGFKLNTYFSSIKDSAVRVLIQQIQHDYVTKEIHHLHKGDIIAQFKMK